MRFIDADALKEEVNKKKVVGRFNTLSLIDNAPSVEVNSIIDGLNNQIDDLSDELAWYVNERNRLLEDRRPQGEWVYVQYDGNPNIGNWHCSECRHLIPGVDNHYPEFVFCPYCGIEMKGSKE